MDIAREQIERLIQLLAQRLGIGDVGDDEVVGRRHERREQDVVILLDERKVMCGENLWRPDECIANSEGQAVRRLVRLQEAPGARKELAWVVDAGDCDGHGVRSVRMSKSDDERFGVCLSYPSAVVYLYKGTAPHRPLPLCMVSCG